MASITWTEGTPQNATAVGQFPGFAKSVWTAIAEGMATEHSWSGSGGASDGSSGDLLPGGSRAYFATQSASSAPSQGTGRLFLASDTSRLLVYESAGTYLAGTPYLSEHQTGVTEGAYWVRFSGSYTTDQASGVTTITFPQPFASFPTVFQSASTRWILGAYVISRSAFSSFFSRVGGVGFSVDAIKWEALGMMSSVSY